MMNNEIFEKIGEPVTKIVDKVTKSYPSNEDLDMAYANSEDGSILADANSLARNRNILAGFLTLVLGGLTLLLVFLVFTKQGRKLAKKMGLKVRGNVARARRKAKATYTRAKTRYRRKK